MRTIRVVSLKEGEPVPFEIRVRLKQQATFASQYSIGRARWMPDGKKIAFIGVDEAGLTGVFVQDFVPGRDTAATRGCSDSGTRFAAFDRDA